MMQLRARTGLCVFVLLPKTFVLFFFFSFFVNVDNKAYVFSIHLPLVYRERELTLLQQWHEIDRLFTLHTLKQRI